MLIQKEERRGGEERFIYWEAGRSVAARKYWIMYM